MNTELMANVYIWCKVYRELKGDKKLSLQSYSFSW